MGNTNDRDTASQSEETKEDGETNLTVKEVDLLMANTSMTRREVVDWYKLFMSEYPDGYITRKQFVELHRRLYPQGSPDKFAKFAFNAFDLDQNGRISFKDFVLSTAFVVNNKDYDVLGEREQRDRLSLAFDTFDINKDRRIDKKELLRLYEALADLDGHTKRFAKQRVKELLCKYDYDKNGTLSKTEFIDAMCHENIFNYFR